jgi:hypothetical protein
MRGLNKNKTGLALGAFLVVVYFVWLVLVAVGLAKPLMDMVFSLQHFAFDYSIAPFAIMPAIGLLIYAFVAGYVLGWIFAAAWNKFGK